MKIVLENIGRRFNKEWIFRRLNYTFEQGQSYAVLGPNGSGKSTLLQVISSSLGPSEGKIQFEKDGEILEKESVYTAISLAAPYLDLMEDFSLREMIDFHFKFKTPLPGIDNDKVIDILGLKHSADKAIRYFSSGMKQRTKLALAVLSDVPILLLDEPTANFDTQGVEWYQELIKQYTSDRLLIVCSNQETEYHFCQHQLRLSDYKDFTGSTL
jgi:ABC-type multidrug transport system ATPase subunit